MADALVGGPGAVRPADPEISRLVRSLPDERRLAGLHRAEAHIDRLFYRAFHELEVMQARRGVRPGPLTARVQFHGFPGYAIDVTRFPGYKGQAVGQVGARRGTTNPQPSLPSPFTERGCG